MEGRLAHLHWRCRPAPVSAKGDGATVLPRRWLLLQEGDLLAGADWAADWEKESPEHKGGAERKKEVGPAVANKVPSWCVEIVEVSSQCESTLVCIDMANGSLCCHPSSPLLLQPQSSLWDKSCLDVQVSCWQHAWEFWLVHAGGEECLHATYWTVLCWAEHINIAWSHGYWTELNLPFNIIFKR